MDKVFEPFMKLQNSNIFTTLFGIGKGSGAAFLFLVLAISGIVVCMIFRKDKHIWTLDESF